MVMTVVGLGQRKVLNVTVGFRGASSVTAAPASSLFLPVTPAKISSPVRRPVKTRC
jgi:hypothetical protein